MSSPANSSGDPPPTANTPLLSHPRVSTPTHRPRSRSRPNWLHTFTVALSTFLLLISFVSFNGSSSPFSLSSQPRTTSSEELGVKLSTPSINSNSSNAVIFAVIGDWGRLGMFNQRETGQGLADALPSDSQCIISVGDNFYDNGVTSIADTQFDDSFENVYTQPILKRLPWYAILGNHDYRGSVQAQIQYSRRSTRWNMPARYFSLWLSQDLMAVFLDTTPFSNSTEGAKARQDPSVNPKRQLAWLNTTLHSAPPTSRFFIIGHHNMYSSSVSDHQGDRGISVNVEPIINPFGHRIVAYVAGHEHSLMHMKPYTGLAEERANYDHFISGGGSKIRPITAPLSSRAEHWRDCCNVLAPSNNQSTPHTVWYKSTNGFFLYKIDGNKFSATAYNADADVIHEHERVLPPV